MKRFLLTLIALSVFIVRSYAACPFIGDEFDNAAIGSQWTVDARNGSIAEQAGAVQITSGDGNLWWDIFTPTRIYQCMDSGDFDVYTKVSAGMNGQYQQAGILFDQGSGGWTSIILRWDNSLQYSVQRRDSVGQSTSTAQVSVSGDVVWLRMKRIGGVFTAYFSNSDPNVGNTWQVVDHGTVEYTSNGEGSIGIFAMHPGSVVFTAQFDYLKALAVAPPPNGADYHIKIAWTHENPDLVLYFPLYISRQSGTGHSLVKNLAKIGTGDPEFTSESIEILAVEGETLYFVLTAVSEDGESNYSNEISVVVPITAPEPFCGDGEKNQPNEECDDGNSINDDGCTDCITDPVIPSAPRTIRIVISVTGVPEGMNVTVETQ